MRLRSPEVASGSGEKEADALFSVISEMGATLRGEQSDATLGSVDSSAKARDPDGSALLTPARAPALQDAQARRRYTETLLDLQSRLLRAATRLERERSSQEERHNDAMQRYSSSP